MPKTGSLETESLNCKDMSVHLFETIRLDSRFRLQLSLKWYQDKVNHWDPKYLCTGKISATVTKQNSYSFKKLFLNLSSARAAALWQNYFSMANSTHNHSMPLSLPPSSSFFLVFLFLYLFLKDKSNSLAISEFVGSPPPFERVLNDHISFSLI